MRFEIDQNSIVVDSQTRALRHRSTVVISAPRQRHATANLERDAGATQVTEGGRAHIRLTTLGVAVPVVG